MKHTALTLLISCLFTAHYTQACEPKPEMIRTDIAFSVTTPEGSQTAHRMIMIPSSTLKSNTPVEKIAIKNHPYAANIRLEFDMPTEYPIVEIFYAVERKKPPFHKAIILKKHCIGLILTPDYPGYQTTRDIPTKNATIVENYEDDNEHDKVTLSFLSHIDPIPLNTVIRGWQY